MPHAHAYESWFPTVCCEQHFQLWFDALFAFMLAETPYLLWYTTHSYMTTKTTPRSLSQHEACAHTHGYTTTMLQDHKHSASHDHRKWNTTILQHDRATRPQSLEHIHDRRLGKIKYTKVSLYTYLLGVKEKAASQTCICITGSVQATCQSLSEGKLAVQLLWKCN